VYDGFGTRWSPAPADPPLSPRTPPSSWLRSGRALGRRAHWEAHDAGDAIQKIYLPGIVPRIGPAPRTVARSASEHARAQQKPSG